MRDFSIKKDSYVNAPIDVSVAPNISPDSLIHEEFNDSKGMSFFDYTDQFIEHVKGFPVLYDDKAELRKYRAKDAWKSIADLLGGKFTVGRLRQYWTQLMRKYKLYLETSQNSCGDIDNEGIFELLSFANIGLQVKRESATSTHYIFQVDDETDNSREYLGDLSEEEHLICEEVDDDEVSAEEEPVVLDDETLQAVETIEENHEPPVKKFKTENEQQEEIKNLSFTPFIPPPPPPPPPTPKEIIPEKSNLPQMQPPIIKTSSDAQQDEYDYFVSF